MSSNRTHHFTKAALSGGLGLLSGYSAILAAVSLGCVSKASPPPVPPASPPSAPEPSPTEDTKSRSPERGPASSHLYVRGRHLYDRCGERVVLRGVNKMSVWTDPKGDALPEIAKTGANSVRLVWTAKDHPGEAELDAILARAISQHLIPIIELHDATGKIDLVPQLVDFWLKPEIVNVLKKHEASLILNIANEPGDHETQAEAFSQVYLDAIARLRGTGLSLPIMIDAPTWGQNIDVLQEAGPQLIQADPMHNLLLSAHLWWVKDADSDDPGSKKRIVTELEESVAMDLPLVIGEFAHLGVGCKKFIDYETILEEAHRHELSWLTWSWGPGNQDCADMDMTEDNRFESLHGWGLNVAVNHPYSIQQTARIPHSMQHGECAP